MPYSNQPTHPRKDISEWGLCTVLDMIHSLIMLATASIQLLVRSSPKSDFFDLALFLFIISHSSVTLYFSSRDLVGALASHLCFSFEINL